MPMHQNCKHFESRSYPNGDTVRKCNLDLAPEAPWRCPEDCPSFTKRRVDVNWSHGALITPETPDEPVRLGEDESIAALLQYTNPEDPGSRRIQELLQSKGPTAVLHELAGLELDSPLIALVADQLPKKGSASTDLKAQPPSDPGPAG